MDVTGAHPSNPINCYRLPKWIAAWLAMRPALWTHQPNVPAPCSPPRQQDANLAWLAANFMAQDHPLVAAMKAQASGTAGCFADVLDGSMAVKAAGFHRPNGPLPGPYAPGLHFL